MTRIGSGLLMFVLNTVGILEIIDIFGISRPRRARAAAIR
jgi:hypothetical protein